MHCVRTPKYYDLKIIARTIRCVIITIFSGFCRLSKIHGSLICGYIFGRHGCYKQIRKMCRMIIAMKS
uniref:Uncharacterized protein n=1 Tax=Pararge aegeria TaxID=116150 RepID=S4NSE7_9NEOP